MKLYNFKSTLIAVFLIITLCLTLSQSSLQNTAWAQDIDEVIQGLEKDFDLGNSKDNVKRSNLGAANEQNREDIKIKEQEATTTTTTTTTPEAITDPVDITLDIEEVAGLNSLSVEIVGGATLAAGVSGSNTPVTFQLQAGSIHTLKVTCTGGGGNCDVWLFFNKGASFIGSSEGPAGFFDSPAVSTMATIQFQVNADNNGPFTMTPGPPI